MDIGTTCKTALGATALTTSLFWSVLAAAQDQAGDKDVLEEIIVTSTKRAALIKDVPFSVNAQSGQDIYRSGANSLEDVSHNVAGLMIQNLGPGQSQVAIRGVSAGQIVRDQPGVKEQVGVYLDESVISLSLFTPDIDLYDLNRVETLRGPQGTLFGSGSVGGTVRYITNQPALGEMESSAEANLNLIDGGGVGGYLKGMINTPLASDKAAVRAVAYYTRYGGFIDALREGGGIDKNVNSGYRVGGRIAFAFQPRENIKITPRLVYQKINMDGFNRQEVFNLYANPFTATRPPVTFKERQQFLLLDEAFNDEFLLADGMIEVGFADVDLVSVTSYTDRDLLVSRDASALTGSVSVDLGFPDAAVMIPSNLRDSTHFKQFTQELRFASNNDGPLQWLIGGFYSHNNRDYSQVLPTPGYDAYTDAVLGAGTAAAAGMGVAPKDSPFYSLLPYKLEQVALFGEATYDFTDQFHLTAGGRYYDYSETRTVTQVGLFANGIVGKEDKTSANGFSPRLLASYDVNDMVTVNAQISKGFRLGGVNDPLNTALCNAQDLQVFGGFQSYEDESLWNYEAGVKMDAGDFALNAAVFYTKIRDLQVTLDAGSCSSRISFNVPKAHTQGLELEMRARAMDGLDLALAFSYVEAEFDSTVVDSAGAVLGGVRKGNRLASVPKISIGGTANYNFALDDWAAGMMGFAGAAFQYRGSIYTQPSDQEPGVGNFASGLAFGGASGNDITALDLELDGYATLNLRAGVNRDNWELALYVNNVTDSNANLSFDRERGGRARLGFRTNEPRTFGVTARVNF